MKKGVRSSSLHHLLYAREARGEDPRAKSTFGPYIFRLEVQESLGSPDNNDANKHSEKTNL